MGHGRSIEVFCDEARQTISVRDFGRGIPLGKLIKCVSQINTGAKYNDDVFQFSVGLNGVGWKAVNALSSHFTVKSVRAKAFRSARFSKGVLIEEEMGKTDESDGTFVQFLPDTEIFGDFHFSEEFLIRRVQYYAFLNSGLSLSLNGQKFVSEQGLLDLIEYEVKDDRLYQPLHAKSSTCELAFLHTSHYGESIFSFVNGQHTSDGGTHVQAFRDGLCRALNEFSKKSLQSVDVREGLVAPSSSASKTLSLSRRRRINLGTSRLERPFRRKSKTSS